MIIRKAKISDIDQIILVFKDYETASVSYLPKKYKMMRNKKKPLEEHIRKALLKDFKTKNSIFLVAEDKGEIIGYIFGEIRDDSHPLYNYPKGGELNDIAVRKKHQGKGVASQLWKELLKWYKSKNCEIVTLNVNANNSAKKMYEKWGFDPFYFRMIKKL